MTPDEVAVSEAKEIIRRSERITVLTGAGISTDSHIPDFRGPNGVWTKNPGAEKRATLEHYLSDPEVRRGAWLSRLDSPVWHAEPNDGHRALLQLERTQQLLMLITQNIDGLHHRAGSDPDRIVEIHGSIREVVCLSCTYRDPMTVALDRVRSGDLDPACPNCAGILKSGTISFGQSLVDDDLMRAEMAARECDVLLAVGSTLAVYPIANVVPVAKRTGASVVILNGESTEMDDYADAVVNGSISEMLPIILGITNENGV